jgi:glutamate synthase (NADPH/NADH) small chain
VTRVPSRWDVAADRLELRFVEKNLPLSTTEAQREAARCLYCVDAPCIHACPTAIDVPTFIRKIATGNLRGAARTILSANLLGASCARVCPVEVLCEGACVYTKDDRPAIPIGRLQRYALEHGGGPALLAKAPPTGRSVGLVGAGPASLACAGQLALLGHSPTIYEKRPLPGGLNTTGVAPYKLRAVDALVEVEAILALGVEVCTGVEVGVDVTADELLARHEAIFLGPGLGPDSRLGVAGEEGPGVVGATAWIESVKTRPAHRLDGVRAAVVVGGGNTAIDAVRALKGLGVPIVTLCYRRSRSEMKAYGHEIDSARREGAVVLENVAVREFVRDRGRLTGVRLVHAEHGQPTDRDVALIPVEFVALAIGQTRLVTLARFFPGVVTDGQGRIVADPVTGGTGHARVFAGGDAVNGGKEVVNAAHDGRAAALAIDAMLRASGSGALPEPAAGRR